MPTDNSTMHTPCPRVTSADELEFYVDLAINESQRWLEATTREPFLNDDDFLFSLRHGSQLRKVINFLLPRSFCCDEVNVLSAQRKACYTGEEGKFKTWTNTFCSVCLRLGIDRQNLLRPNDLEEGIPNEGSANGRYRPETLDRIRRVVVTIYELARLCESSAHYSGPRIDRTAVEPLLFCRIGSVFANSVTTAILDNRKALLNANCGDSPAKTTQEVTESEESGCGSSINDPSQHSSSEDMDQTPSCHPEVDPLVRDKVTKYLIEQVVNAGTPAEDQFSESQFSDNTFRSFSPEDFDRPASSASTSINAAHPRLHVRPLSKPVQCDLVRHDPHRFVASKPATLAQRAVSQLQLIDLEKKARNSRVIVKDDEVDWLANLNSWKLKRRAMNHGKPSQESETHEGESPSADSGKPLKRLPCPTAALANNEKNLKALSQGTAAISKGQMREVEFVGKKCALVAELTEEMVALPEETCEANACLKNAEGLAYGRISNTNPCSNFGAGSLNIELDSSLRQQALIEQATFPANLSKPVSDSEVVGVRTNTMGNCMRKSTREIDRTDNPIHITSYITSNGTASEAHQSSLAIHPVATDVVPARIDQDVERNATSTSRCINQGTTASVLSLDVKSSDVVPSAGQREKQSCTDFVSPSVSRYLQVTLRQRAKQDRGFGFTLRGGKNSGVPIQVDCVVTGSPADFAGLKSGHIVTAINGLSIENDYLAKANMLVREAALMGELDLSIRLCTTGEQDSKLQKQKHFSCESSSDIPSADANEGYTRASFERRRSRFTGSLTSDRLSQVNIKTGVNKAKEERLSGTPKQLAPKTTGINKLNCGETICAQNGSDAHDSIVRQWSSARPLTPSSSADYRVVSMHEQKVPGKISDFVPEYERDAERSKYNCASIRTAQSQERPSDGLGLTELSSSYGNRRIMSGERPTLLRNYDLCTIATNLRSSSSARPTSDTAPASCLKPTLDMKDQGDRSAVKYRYSNLPPSESSPEDSCFQRDSCDDVNGNQHDVFHSPCGDRITSSGSEQPCGSRDVASPIRNIYSHWMIREEERKRLSEQLSTVRLDGAQKLFGSGSTGSENSLMKSESHCDQFFSVSAKHRCAHCGEELGPGCAMCVESLSLVYHLKCFKCHVCGVSLGDGAAGADVRIRSDKLHCQSCYSNDEAGYRLSEV